MSSDYLEITKAVGDWLINDEIGLSSQTLASWFLGGKAKKDYYIHHPHDPSDLMRCKRLVDGIPGGVLLIGGAGGLSHGWKIVVEHWNELMALLEEEYRTDSAPKTYKRMKELGL